MAEEFGFINARVRVMDNKNDYFMKLSKTAIVQITYSFIDCGGNVVV